MNKFLVPISFSESSAHALRFANSIPTIKELTLLHSYSPHQYNRAFDFGDVSYERGIQGMLEIFFSSNVISGTTVNYLPFEGTIVQAMKTKSKFYDWIIMTSKQEFPADHFYWGKKLLNIISYSKSNVLLLPMKSNLDFSDKMNIVWEIQFNDADWTQSDKLQSLGIKYDNYFVKTIDQDNFVSSFYEKLLKYFHSGMDSLLHDIHVQAAKEKIDLIVMSNYHGDFLNLFEKDILQILNGLGIPVALIKNH